MPSLEFSIPTGYIVVQKTSVVDIDEAVEILSSRKHRKYISAHRSGYELTAELRKDVWVCPFCGYEYPTTFMDNYTHEFDKYLDYDIRISRAIVERWGTHQISMLDNDFEDIVFTQPPVISGEWECPKCNGRSCPADGKREVFLEYDEKMIKIKAEICGVSELLSIPWITGDAVTIHFPIYEVLTFSFESGKSRIELQGADGATIAGRDITADPYVWEKGVVYQLISENRAICRKIRRVFSDKFGGEIPFAKDEMTPDKYVLMTRFVGFPREFYDAVPYARGTFQIEETFKDIAEKIHSLQDTLALFESAEIPKCKSVKKIFFTNLGLLFYLQECETLWEAVRDVNHYRSLMENENIFDVLSILHQRPILFDFVFDYGRVKGAKAMIEMVTDKWVISAEYAIDYCTMNYPMKLAEQKRWKKRPSRRGGEDDDFENDLYLHRYENKVLFSVPMKTPIKSIENCVIDDFSFFWLRSGNEYYMAGEELKNCLAEWTTVRNPVVAIKNDEKIVAAVEVGPSGVHQVRGYRNTGISQVPGLCEAYRKWLDKYKLSRTPHYTHEDLPF